jgi:hypothetical protein
MILQEQKSLVPVQIHKWKKAFILPKTYNGKMLTCVRALSHIVQEYFTQFLCCIQNAYRYTLVEHQKSRNAFTEAQLNIIRGSF